MPAENQWVGEVNAYGMAAKKGSLQREVTKRV